MEVIVSLISRAFWKKLEPTSNLDRKIVALAIDAEALPTKQKTFLLRVEPRVFSPTLVASFSHSGAPGWTGFLISIVIHMELVRRLID